MTWTTDNTGTRWVELPPRKRRKPAKGRRFAKVKAGDHLMNMRTFAHSLAEKVGRLPLYYLVTDAWFDPVEGQENREKGELFAVQCIDQAGEPSGMKASHTRLGLAHNGYHYADIDYIGFAKARAENKGAFVGIGQAHVIRKRPKLPGGRL